MPFLELNELNNYFSNVLSSISVFIVLKKRRINADKHLPAKHAKTAKNKTTGYTNEHKFRSETLIRASDAW